MNWIVPMEPNSTPLVKSGEDFVHEVKWDGIRGMVYLQNGSVKIFTKRGNERTDFYPELKPLETLSERNSIVLDGEIVVLDETGKPNFHNALVRETVKSKRNLQYYLKNYPVKYIVFDILMNEDKLLTKTELIYRKQILQKVLSPVVHRSETILISEDFSDGQELYELMKKRNMEGIVSKRLNSFYFPGKKHGEWFKTKFIKKMLCIVGGIVWKDDLPNSLVMGIRTQEHAKLMFMGKASLGLKGSDLQLLRQYKDDLRQMECPFEVGEIGDMDRTGGSLTWTLPVLTCWVSFLELSNDGRFRHPKILGFTNLPPEEANGKVLSD